MPAGPPLRFQVRLTVLGARRSCTPHRRYQKLQLSFVISGRGLGFVTNRLDVVPVRTNDESCVVVSLVLWAQTRRTIVFAARLQCRAIESFDLLAILGSERKVKMRRPLLGLVQAQ